MDLILKTSCKLIWNFRALAALGVALSLLISLQGTAQIQKTSEANSEAVETLFSTQLKIVSEATRELIHEAHPQVVEWEKLKDFWGSLERTGVDSRCHRTNFGKTVTQNITRRFQTMFSEMWRQNRILYFNSEVLKGLGLENSMARAFYLPMTHQILIRQDLAPEDFSKALYHELFHAYQYSYRYALDVGTLAQLSEANEITPEELRAYLDFFYEAQANWKTMRWDPEPQWRNLLGSFRVNGFVVRSGKFYAIGAALGIPGVLAAILIDGYTNRQGQTDVFENTTIPHEVSSGPDAALCLDELVLIKKDLPKLMQGASWNFGFHRDFGGALARTYFGEVSFLYQNNKKDLSIFSKIHENYYGVLANSDKLEKDPSCQKVMAEIYAADSSPLVQWMTLPEETLKSCQVFSQTRFPELRSKYRSTLMQNQNGMQSSYLELEEKRESAATKLSSDLDSRSARLGQEIKKLEEVLKSSKSSVPSALTREGLDLKKMPTPFKTRMSGEGSTPWLTIYPQLDVLPLLPEATERPRVSPPRGIESPGEAPNEK